jgi:hypothetical protein
MAVPAGLVANRDAGEAAGRFVAAGAARPRRVLAKGVQAIGAHPGEIPRGDCGEGVIGGAVFGGAAATAGAEGHVCTASKTSRASAAAAMRALSASAAASAAAFRMMSLPSAVMALATYSPVASLISE